LAYNSVGGGILFLEATQASFPTDFGESGEKTQSQARGSLRVTGRLGEVMKESSSIAQTYSKAFLYEHFSKKQP